MSKTWTYYLNSFDRKTCVRIFMSIENLVKYDRSTPDKYAVLSYDGLLGVLYLSNFKSPLYPNSECEAVLLPERLFLQKIGESCELEKFDNA